MTNQVAVTIDTAMSVLIAWMNNSVQLQQAIAQKQKEGRPGFTQAEWQSITGPRDSALAKFDADISAQKGLEAQIAQERARQDAQLVGNRAADAARESAQAKADAVINPPEAEKAPSAAATSIASDLQKADMKEGKQPSPAVGAREVQANLEARANPVPKPDGAPHPQASGTAQPVAAGQNPALKK